MRFDNNAVVFECSLLNLIEVEHLLRYNLTRVLPYYLSGLTEQAKSFVPSKATEWNLCYLSHGLLDPKIELFFALNYLYSQL